MTATKPASQSEWSCDVCRRSGTIRYRSNALIPTVVRLVMAAHAKASPKCPAPNAKHKLNLTLAPPAVRS